MTPKLTLLAIALALSLAAGAQYNSSGPDYVIKIDSLTRQTDKPIPFDQPFTIILTPRDPAGVIGVFAYPVVRDKPGYTHIDVGTVPFAKPTPTIRGPQVVIDFPAIKPNFNFDFCLIRQLDGDTLDEFMGYANYVAKALIVRPAPTDAEKLAKDNKYYYFVNKLKRAPNRYDVVATTWQYDFLFTQNCPGGPGYNCAQRGLEQTIAGSALQHYLAIYAVAPALTEYADLHDDLVAVSKKMKARKISDQTIAALIRIFTPSATGTIQESNLYSGLVSMDYTYQTSPVSLDDLKKRLANLDLSYQRLLGLQDTVERINNELPAFDPQIQHATEALKRIAAEVYRVKKAIADEYTPIKKYFQDLPATNYAEWYTHNTDGVKDLKTKSGNIFSPQIGITFLRLPKNTGGYQVIPKLAIGVNINFRDINKNLYRKDIPHKDWRHYLSGFVGLTFGNFRDSIYQNLFASNSLFFGLNYRITRSFYFSLGGTIIRQQYKDPVINDFHTQFALNASLMLDLDLASAASSITSLIYK